MSLQTTQQSGFTLIELMVASAIFVLVTVTGVSVLLNATNNYRTTSEIRQSLDTLSFAMEDMTRSIRLGTNFHCITWTNIDQFNPCEVNTSTTLGQMGGLFIALEAYNGNSQDANDQVAYWITSRAGGQTTDDGILYKKTQTSLGAISGNNPQNMSIFSPITPNNIYLDLLKSGFSVSNPGNASSTPVITIRLVGKVKYRTTEVPFALQSTVAPRNLPQPVQ